MPIASPELRARVTNLLDTHGTEKVSKGLVVSPEALARFVGGLKVREGTIAQVEKRLTECEADLRQQSMQKGSTR